MPWRLISLSRRRLHHRVHIADCCFAPAFCCRFHQRRLFFSRDAAMRVVARAVDVFLFRECARRATRMCFCDFECAVRSSAAERSDAMLRDECKMRRSALRTVEVQCTARYVECARARRNVCVEQAPRAKVSPVAAAANAHRSITSSTITCHRTMPVATRYAACHRRLFINAKICASDIRDSSGTRAIFSFTAGDATVKQQPDVRSKHSRACSARCPPRSARNACFAAPLRQSVYARSYCPRDADVVVLRQFQTPSGSRHAACRHADLPRCPAR